MEYPLTVYTTDSFRAIKSLNPCSNGIPSDIKKLWKQLSKVLS